MWHNLHQFIISITTGLAADLHVPKVMVEYFLMLPFVVVLLAFFRHVVGLKTIGLFFPILIAVIFAYNGFTYGLILIAAVAVLTFVGRSIARPFRLLYLPRSAFVLTFVTIGFFWTVLWLTSVLPQRPVDQMPLMSFLVLLLFTEDFLRVLGEKGARTGLLLLGETVLLAMFGGLFLRWYGARAVLYSYPEMVLIVPILALALNQWNGLRLAELYRFRKIRRKLATSKK